MKKNHNKTFENEDYVQLTVSSNNTNYNGIVVTMPLTDFGSVLAHMEKNKLRAHFDSIQQNKIVLSSNQLHPISEF